MPPLSRRDALRVGTLGVVLGANRAEAAETAPTAMTTGLRFPEGPIAMADGSVLICEIAAGRVTRVRADGRHEIVANTGGGPNGAAIGPDGALYVCNNGGFTWSESGGKLMPGGRAADYAGGRIERVDLKTGKVTVLYREVDGHRLSAPNDLVFDDHGGFWFTDHGATTARTRDNGGLYYAKADGSFIKEVIYPMIGPNGLALSPDGRTIYVALTYERVVLAFGIKDDGVVDPGPGFLPGRPVVTLPAGTLLDSMKVEADGTLCVATLLVDPGIMRFKPSGERIGFVPCADPLTTSIAFGGKDLRDAFITLSTTGVLLKARWAAPGLKLNFQSA